jgi:hypothetical protein
MARKLGWVPVLKVGVERGLNDPSDARVYADMLFDPSLATYK